MKIPNIKDKLLLIDLSGIAVCIVVSLAAYFIAVKPAIKGLSVLAGRNQSLTAQREKAVNLKSSLTSLESRLAGVQDELDRSEIKILSADQVNTRIAELNVAFGNCDLEVDDVRIGQSQLGMGRIGDLQVDVLPISITGRGGYKQSTMFLHELGKAFSDMDLAKVEVWGDPTKPEEPRRFRFEFLWRTLPKKVASAG